MDGYKLGFRFDLLGLSTEDLPETMEDGTPLIDGSTFYEVDTMKFYIFYKGEWYLQAPSEDEGGDDEPISND